MLRSVVNEVCSSSITVSTHCLLLQKCSCASAQHRMLSTVVTLIRFVGAPWFEYFIELLQKRVFKQQNHNGIQMASAKLCVQRAFYARERVQKKANMLVE